MLSRLLMSKFTVLLQWLLKTMYSKVIIKLLLTCPTTFVLNGHWGLIFMVFNMLLYHTSKCAFCLITFSLWVCVCFCSYVMDLLWPSLFFIMWIVIMVSYMLHLRSDFNMYLFGCFCLCCGMRLWHYGLSLFWILNFQGILKICQLPSGSTYDNYWPVQKVFFFLYF